MHDLFNFHYYKIDVITNFIIKAPFFIGSQLRGAFGVALKRIVCINIDYICHGCKSSEECLYYNWYENKNSYHHYRFDIQLNTPHFDFSLYLFEESYKQLPYVVSAIEMMISQIGLGRERHKGIVSSIKVNNLLIYDGRNFTLQVIQPYIFVPRLMHSHIQLSFLTPLRLKLQNKILSDLPELKQILTSIWHRLNELKGEHRTKLPFEVTAKVCKSQVHFLDLTRYSNRQQTKMQLGGIVGDIIYENLNYETLCLLAIGEILGVGKSTVFGLGKIAIKEIM